jgi:hypothetical protein
VQWDGEIAWQQFKKNRSLISPARMLHMMTLVKMHFHAGKKNPPKKISQPISFLTAKPVMDKPGGL